MTCYLTDTTDPAKSRAALREGVFTAVKLYPAHATTNSAHGVTDIARVMPVLERMAAIGMPLLDPRRGRPTPTSTSSTARRCSSSGCSTRCAAGCPSCASCSSTSRPRRRSLTSRRAAPNLAATITAHHLIINRNAIFARAASGRISIACRSPSARSTAWPCAAPRPRATRHFFLGTDSAPHAVPTKETACGCAGIFTAPAALELYAEVFEEEGALDHFEAFASLNGPAFYRLPANEGRVTLRREAWTMPERIGDGDFAVAPFRAGESLRWRLEG